MYLMGNQVVYTKGWEGTNINLTSSLLAGKQAELDAINADGSDYHMVKSFAPSSYPTSGYDSIALITKLYAPDELYVDSHDNGTDTFYEYANGGVSPMTNVSADSFYSSTYPTYLLSPSGNSTFWDEPRDGKSTLFVGDENGGSQKQIANLSPYSPYGWYSDNYLLVSQNSSELYIMPAAGTPLKITDYYKPLATYNGYGGL